MVGRVEVGEGDIVLAVDYEACNVERSEADPPVGVRCKVARASKLIQTCRNVHDLMTVHENL